jgi:SAM-dependent MidA family methyltransferase
VDFSAIQQAGEAEGLRTEFFGSQARFLAGVLADSTREGPQRTEWSSSRLQQIKTVIHPEHFGRAFCALCQTREPAV